MSSLPLDPELKNLFDDVTLGRQDEASVRAIFVQNDNGNLRLVTTEPESSTDREDFSTVLGKLFAKDPSKPGYALYRLDSKSPAGLCEWINCAYRPEGAKVREKMQYTLTQTSLFKALDEQHFLETVYGGSVNEFSFPTRLRNQRKHDYQNPQQSTSGKKAAEAAGTGTAGRRNFDKIPAPGAIPQKKHSTASETFAAPADEKPPTPPLSKVEQAPAAEVSARSPVKAAADLPPRSPPIPEHSEPEPQAQAKEEDEEIDAVQETTTATADIEEPSKGLEELKVEEREPEVEEQKSVEESVKDYAPLSALSALSPDPSNEPPIQDDIMQQSIAPSSYAELTEEAVEQEPSEVAMDPIAEEPEVRSSSTRIDPEVKPSTTSVGMGTGSQGLETERERHLAHLKSEEQKLKSSSSQGGSHIGFAWQDDVEPALHGLSKRLGGTSEWNLVVLRIDLSKEEIELASQPRFVLPGDFSEVLPDSEPCYAFYSHPAVQTDGDDSSQVVVIYVCPLHSSVRQRMLYSANLATTSNRVSGIRGLTLLKRLETSDPRELTASFFAEELLGQVPADAGQAKALSRPKRPGRR